MARGGEKVTVEPSWMDEKLPFTGNPGEGALGRQSSQCKGPEAGTCLACLRNLGKPVWEEMRAETGQDRLFRTSWAVVRNIFRK